MARYRPLASRPTLNSVPAEPMDHLSRTTGIPPAPPGTSHEEATMATFIRRRIDRRRARRRALERVDVAGFQQTCAALDRAVRRVDPQRVTVGG